MKTFFTLLFANIALFPAIARAQYDSFLDDVADNADINTTTSATDVVANVIGIVLGLLGVVFLVLLIYAGILWMTAAGNSDQVDKARNILVTSIIGLVITLAAFSISNFVVDSLLTATGNS